MWADDGKEVLHGGRGHLTVSAVLYFLNETGQAVRPDGPVPTHFLFGGT